MAAKPKKKPKPKTNDNAQSERFKETARQLGVDETGKSFNEAFRRLVPPKTKASTDGG
jgi:hypothetical protein